MSNEAISQTNAAVTSKIRTTATEIGQAVNQFIYLTSDQIVAYVSKMGQLLTAEHNRYNQRPLSTTLLAGNQKSAQSPQQGRTVSKSVMEKIAGFAKKAEQFQSLYEIPSGTPAFYVVAFLSKLTDSGIAKEAKNAFHEERVLNA